MDIPVSRAMLWRALGLVVYLVGLVLSLLIVVEPFVTEGPAPSSDRVVQRIPLLLFSILLILVGRGISWKFGGAEAPTLGAFGRSSGREREREQSTLERLGYVDSTPAEDAPVEEDATDDRVICEQCGTRNEAGFTYCRNCSAELPG